MSGSYSASVTARAHPHPLAVVVRESCGFAPRFNKTNVIGLWRASLSLHHMRQRAVLSRRAETLIHAQQRFSQWAAVYTLRRCRKAEAKMKAAEARLKVAEARLKAHEEHYQRRAQQAEEEQSVPPAVAYLAASTVDEDVIMVIGFHPNGRKYVPISETPESALKSFSRGRDCPTTVFKIVQTEQYPLTVREEPNHIRELVLRLKHGEHSMRHVPPECLIKMEF